MARVASGQIGVWKTICEKAFKGNQRIMRGRPNCVCSDAAPDFVAKVGTLCWDKTNSNAYICSVASGTWIQINA